MKKTDEKGGILAFATSRKASIQQDMLNFNAAFGETIAQMPDYEEQREHLEKLFSSYRYLQDGDPLCQWIDRWISLHEEFCRCSRSEIYIRQHNVFVRVYILGSHDSKAVARLNHTSRRTAQRDINTVLDRLMILIFGAGGVRFEQT